MRRGPMAPGAPHSPRTRGGDTGRDGDGGHGDSVGRCERCRAPPDTTDDHTLLWLLNHIRLGIPELIVQVRHHKHTRVYAFFVTATYER